MKFFKVMVAGLLMAVSSLSFAVDTQAINQAGWNNLTPSQQADILKQVADTSAKQPTAVNQVVENASTEKVKEWASVGTQIAQGVAAAAKELGIAVNDFAKTPVGKWTLFLIIWHIMGGLIVHLAGGLLVLLFGFTLVLVLYRGRTRSTPKYSSTDKNIFGNYAKIGVSKDELTSGEATELVIISAITVVLTLICIFTF
ncbi:MAG TPA: hypothetical protein VFM18_14260 [Methanosarcina sp.]|nr:hypothetical protein [Methanosarcina sp.]